MARGEEVLPDERELELAQQPPGVANVHRRISRDTRVGQRADAADSDVEFRAVGQIERRAQKPLVRRIVARSSYVGISAVRLRAQALPQEERPRAQAPVARCLIATPGLES